jgi:hypothetical protein
MEINSFDDVQGVFPTADVVEGRMVLIAPYTVSYDFGSRTDLPGARVPATAEEARRANKVIAWAPTNQQMPYVVSYPSYTSALRYGFDKSAQTPFTNTMYVTWPGNQLSMTIPSGTPALAFSDGIFTFPSGAFIASASWAVGAPVIVANTAEDTTDAGKLKYQSTIDYRVVGFVLAVDSTNNTLTVEIKD